MTIGTPSRALTRANLSAAHALTVWLFLAAPAAKAGISSLSLGALLLAFSILEGHWLGKRNLERGAPNLALAALAFPLAFWSGRTDAACVAVETIAPAAWAEGLRARGHDVTEIDGVMGTVGHAHIIEVDDEGLAGAADPRALISAAIGY